MGRSVRSVQVAMSNTRTPCGEVGSDQWARALIQASPVGLASTLMR